MTVRARDLVGTADDAYIDAYLLSIRPASGTLRESPEWVAVTECHDGGSDVGNARFHLMDCNLSDQACRDADAAVVDWDRADRLTQRVHALFPHLTPYEAVLMAGNIADSEGYADENDRKARLAASFTREF